jgi:KDO2-lipid IV(A) lauroyltransferase
MEALSKPRPGHLSGDSPAENHSAKRHPGYTGAGFRLGYGAARLLPRNLCRGLGSMLALASYFGNGQSRAALRQNLKQVVGGSSSTLEWICRENFRNFGRMLADYFSCAGASAPEIRALLDEWHGIENLRAALALGRGVVLVTAHLGNWELGGTLLALDGWPVNIVTLEEPTGELTRMRDDYRKRLGIRTIALGENTFAFVEMIAALRRNEIVCMLVDRPYADTGTSVKFFGRETSFSSGPVLLWKHTGAAVIPAFVLQNGRGRYQAFAEPAIPLEPLATRHENSVENTQQIASVFEAIIRSHPEQWFNYVPIWKNETAPLPHAGGG